MKASRVFSINLLFVAGMLAFIPTFCGNLMQIARRNKSDRKN